MRKSLALFTLGVVIAAVTTSVIRKEQTLAVGQPMFLALAPRDPRSLMQGDYMVLRYQMATAVPMDGLARKGRLVVSLDTNNVATFARVYSKGKLAANEHLLVYRKRDGLRLGAESFFFQEGDAHFYDRARYGELRVAASGHSVLVGLLDEKLQPLGRPPASRPDASSPEPGRP